MSSEAPARSPPSVWYSAPAQMLASVHPVTAHTLCYIGSLVTRIVRLLGLARAWDSQAAKMRPVLWMRALGALRPLRE